MKATMRKIVITGATGYLGSAITHAIRRKNPHDEVIGVGRSADVDIARPETLRGAIEGADIVVHAALASGPDAAEIDRRFVESALSILRRTRGRFVYTSGLWVLGDTGGRIADESTPPIHPAEIVGWRPEVERVLLAADVASWIIRPAIVYGGSGGLLKMLGDSLAGTGAVTVVGDGENHWPLVHRDDLGEIYARAIDLAPAQRILHATERSDLTARKIAAAVVRAHGGGGVVRSQALEDARRTMGPLADALALDQRVSSDLTRRALDFTPRHRFS